MVRNSVILKYKALGYKNTEEDLTDYAWVTLEYLLGKVKFELCLEG